MTQIISIKHVEGDDWVFVFEDGSEDPISIYEYHGYMRVKDLWIVYGHEQLQVYSNEGLLIKQQFTR
jgi:hypothetical protein